MATLKPLTESEIVKLNGVTNTYALANERTIKYIVVHYSTSLSSNNGAARNSAHWFSQEVAGCSADYIVDDNEFIQYSANPLRRACWAVGGNLYNGTKGGSKYNECTNMNSVSVELSSQNTHKDYMPQANDPSWSFTEKVLNNGIRIVRYLMEKHGLDIHHVIRHYDVNGKPCPGIIGWNLETGSEEKWKHFLYCVKNNCSWDTKENTTKKTIYAVQIGAYEHKSNAEAFLRIVKGTYSDAFIVEKEV